METSRNVTLLSTSFADAVLKLDALIDEQSTELNIRNKHQWWPVVHDAVRKQLSSDEQMILEEKLSRKRPGEPLSEDAIRQRDAKRTLQLRVSRAKQEVQRMFKRRRNKTPTRSKSCVRLCEEYLLFCRRHENSWVLRTLAARGGTSRYTHWRRRKALATRSTLRVPDSVTTLDNPTMTSWLRDTSAITRPLLTGRGA